MNKIVDLRISAGKNLVEVFWRDNHISRFHSCWLRYNCRCKTCKRTVVGQAKLDRTQFPDELLVTKFEIHESAGQIWFWINGDIPTDHVTIQDIDWLRMACYCDQCIASMISEKNREFLDPQKDDVPKFNYKDLDTDEGTYELLNTFLNTGFVLIKSVPLDHHRVLKLAERYGSIIESTYGKVFEVFAQEGKENIVNMPIALRFHADQVHYESAPQGQLLHAIKFDDCIEGGYSQLVDMINVAKILKEESPKDFEVLARVPVVFSTIDYDRETPAHFTTRKTVIDVDYDDQIVSVSWNPGLEDTLRVHEEDVEAFYSAYKKIWRIIHRKELAFHFRLEVGDVLMFNNRRMVHGRDAYKCNGGERVLQGVNFSLEELRSNYVVLGRKLGRDFVAPKIGNKSAI